MALIEGDGAPGATAGYSRAVEKCAKAYPKGAKMSQRRAFCRFFLAAATAAYYESIS
jgi:hypothetical protein